MPALTDPWFEAEFVAASGNGFHRQGGQIDGAQGIFLYSPCGYGLPSGVHCVLIWFANPRGAPPAPPSLEPTTRWAMSGNGLHDLTLSPSINCQVSPANAEYNLKAGECRPGRLCWHGFITSGQVS